MTQLKKILYKRVDSFSLLLLFFAVVLFSLFFYLLKIDNNIRHYNYYRQQLQKMGMLNHKIETVFYQKYRYIDYDETSRILRTFQVSITQLEQSQMKQEFGEHIYQDLLTLGKDYQRKEYLLQKFEALNSRLTNSMHTIFDLRKTIEHKLKPGEAKQEELHQVFFILSQILMDMPYDRQELEHLMSQLKKYQKERAQFKYLYLHMQHFLINVKEMKMLLAENKKIDLPSEIRHMINDLSTYYTDMRNKQKIIALSFFSLAFLILLLLIFNYRREKRKTRELLAFKYAIENSDNVIVITDTDRHIEFVNEAFEVHTGYSKEEVYGRNPNILKSDLVEPEVYQSLNETLDRGEKWQGELINRKKDGSLLYERTSIVPIFMEGELVQYLAIKLDVTEYIRQQKILQQSATVYDTIGDGILIANSDRKIVSVNKAFSHMFGYTEEELEGKEPGVIMELKEAPVFYKKMWYRLLSTGRWAGRVNNRAKNGKRIPVWLTIAIVRNDKNKIQNFIAIYTNLEEIIEMEDKANFLAYHDSLTKLPNRTQFEREIVDILELANIEKKKIAVLFIDLDRFKVINDTLGHHIGDEMLIHLSHRIRSVLDDDDLLARIGGDEFVVVLNVKKDKKEAGMIAQKLLTVIREPIGIYDYHLNTTASIGIALYPDDGKDRNEIVKHADSAMYYAKEKGKDNFQFYTKQLSLDVEARLKLEQELLYALQKKELTLFYQPQYDLESRKVIGAEALLRWNNEHLGTVSPDEFISVAEETGLIIDIGYFVFEEACRTYMHWRELGLDVESISINISSIQFREDDVFEYFEDIILRTGIPAHKIEIEITERFIMEYSTTNLTILEDLRNIGCKISIDDFGTGYSSMSYIKSLALDTIKIDKSFISDLPDDSHDAEVSKAIIALSKSLGYLVVAEGIETAEQEAFLRTHGCDIGQGFYFAKPMSSEAFIGFVKNSKKG
ncbi:diguanylate cyclase/phosphodiesterase (GGDEF & EAL domains) with PAS/PAC sensor(s) [hydrothermal vent metagenome]|uniref:Diguanylate cyclase/phosphodiesterase (GGDEF & EAL domains) with PAS/PAC sensor(S) n=1 Tax=hydrothermal vent metagenome TaxID=652676 RepID=A0A1W1CF68_9ZZZZ